jgi:hypothetical protein
MQTCAPVPQAFALVYEKYNHPTYRSIFPFLQQISSLQAYPQAPSFRYKKPPTIRRGSATPCEIWVRKELRETHQRNVASLLAEVNARSVAKIFVAGGRHHRSLAHTSFAW